METIETATGPSGSGARSASRAGQTIAGVVRLLNAVIRPADQARLA